MFYKVVKGNDGIEYYNYYVEIGGVLIAVKPSFNNDYSKLRILINTGFIKPLPSKK